MDDAFAEIISAQTSACLAYHVALPWSRQKMGRAAIQSETIRLTHSFRRNAPMPGGKCECYKMLEAYESPTKCH